MISAAKKSRKGSRKPNDYLMRLSSPPKCGDQITREINGIVFRDLNNNIIFNQVEKVVPQSRMDIDMPGYAWDLLPFKKKAF